MRRSLPSRSAQGGEQRGRRSTGSRTRTRVSKRQAGLGDTEEGTSDGHAPISGWGAGGEGGQSQGAGVPVPGSVKWGDNTGCVVRPRNSDSPP